MPLLPLRTMGQPSKQVKVSLAAAIVVVAILIAFVVSGATKPHSAITAKSHSTTTTTKPHSKVPPTKPNSTIQISITNPNGGSAPLSVLNGHSLTLLVHQILVLPKLAKGGNYTVTSNPTGVVTYASGHAKGTPTNQMIPLLVASATGKAKVTVTAPSRTIKFTITVKKH